MIKLIIAIKRKSSFTQEEFREYLSTTHAKLVRECPASQKFVRKYVQSYTLPIGIDGRQLDTSSQGFDAASELWFDTTEDMQSFFFNPDYLANVRPDESKFSDMEHCVFFVTEERQII